MKQETLLWYVRMMDLSQDTDDRMKLILLAFDEGETQGVTKTLEKLSTPVI